MAERGLVMASKRNLQCQCPWCNCQVIVCDYPSRYPGALCVCRKPGCLAKEKAWLDAEYRSINDQRQDVAASA